MLYTQATSVNQMATDALRAGLVEKPQFGGDADHEAAVRLVLNFANDYADATGLGWTVTEGDQHINGHDATEIMSDIERAAEVAKAND